LRLQLLFCDFPLFLLGDHVYAPGDAFPGTDSAAFAIVQVGYKIIVFRFIDGHVGAEYIANPATDASVLVDHGLHGAPVARFVLPCISGFLDNTSDFQILPSKILFRF
jgi:hypothetical protein